MEPIEVLLIFKKFTRLITALTICTLLMVAAVDLFLMEEKYESRAVIVLNSKLEKPCEDPNVKLFDKYDIKVLFSIAQSDQTHRDTVNRLQWTMEPKQLRKKLDLAQDEDTGIIKITATSADPANAQKLATAYIETLSIQSKQFLTTAAVHVIDPPPLPVQPASPNLPLDLILALFTGLFSGMLLAILLEYREQTRYQISALLPLPWLFQLGNLPRCKTEAPGWPPFFPDDSPGANALHTLGTNLLYQVKHHGVTTIFVTSVHPGDGKTVLCSNLARAATQQGQRVLVLDHQEIDFAVLPTFLEVRKNDYDLILLDGPAVHSNSDTLLLADIARTVVLVADYRKLQSRVLEQSAHRLTGVGARILGVVINYVPERKIR